MKITISGGLEITMKRKVFFRSQNLVKETSAIKERSVSQNDMKITIISGEVRAETNGDIFPTKRLHLTKI